MYIIVEAIRLDKKYSDSLKFDYNVVKKDFNDLPSHLKESLNIIIPEDVDGNRYVAAPVVSHHEFSSSTEFNVVAGFNELDDAIAYCKTKNSKLIRTFGYTISISIPDEDGLGIAQALNNYVRFSSYEDVIEPYLLNSGRKLLNVKESIVRINEEGEDDGEQSGREEGMEETCKQAGICGCSPTETD